jgi:hypothetical protein
VSTALAASGFSLLTATPVAGVPLVNGTPVILSWTAPSDGKFHRVFFFASLDVAVTQVGGDGDAVRGAMGRVT